MKVTGYYSGANLTLDGELQRATEEILAKTVSEMTAKDGIARGAGAAGSAAAASAT